MSMTLRLLAFTSVSLLIKRICSRWGSIPDRSRERRRCYPLYYQCLLEIYIAAHGSHNLYTQRSLRDRMHVPKGILSRLAFSKNYYWKIAGLRPAIFSGTPRNLEAMIRVFEPWPQNGLWPLTSYCRSSAKLKRKCICRGSSLQKETSSSFHSLWGTFYSSASV